MKKTVLLSFLTAGALCLQPAMAQAPGGGAGVPSQSSPSSQSAQRPSSMEQQPGMAGQDTASQTSRKMDDKKFVKEAAIGGMTEVELGKIAAQKASRDDVKQFGQKMVDDHTKANDQLKEIASKENIQIPDSLDSKHQSMVEKMSKLSGADFDKAYVKAMLKDHKEDVSDFQSEAQNGTDPNVKAFASATLPTLQEHLDMVKNLSKSDKSGAKQSAGGQ